MSNNPKEMLPTVCNNLYDCNTLCAIKAAGISVKVRETPEGPNNDDDDDVYLRLQHGQEFHNLVYMSYVKHINPAYKAQVINTTIQSIYATT
jgi:hypothetical protein